MAPITEPTLVPAMKSMGRFSSSKTFNAPMWASPRANPPPKARPIFGRFQSAFGDSASSVMGRVSSLLNAFTERTILDNWLKRSPELGGEAAYIMFDAKPELPRCRRAIDDWWFVIGDWNRQLALLCSRGIEVLA